MNYFNRGDSADQSRGGPGRYDRYDRPYRPRGYDTFRSGYGPAAADSRPRRPHQTPSLYDRSYRREYQEQFSRRPTHGDVFPEHRLTDEDLREAVRRSLIHDRWLAAEDIQITVERGVVTLSGSVEDYMAARYAWDDAWETRGVRGVISRIEVRDATQGEDEAPSGQPEG